MRTRPTDELRHLWSKNTRAGLVVGAEKSRGCALDVLHKRGSVFVTHGPGGGVSRTRLKRELRSALLPPQLVGHERAGYSEFGASDGSLTHAPSPVSHRRRRTCFQRFPSASPQRRSCVATNRNSKAVIDEPMHRAPGLCSVGLGPRELRQAPVHRRGGAST